MLLEVVIGAALAVILLSAVAAMLVGAMSGARQVRLRQEAVALAGEQIDFVRGLEWTEVGMVSIDDTAPMIDGVSLLAAEVNLTEDEPLLVLDGGMVAPVSTVTADETGYTIWSYVTSLPDGLRRLVVLVTWEYGDSTQTHRSSTILSQVVSG